MLAYTFRRKNIVQWFFQLIKLVTWVSQSSLFLYGQSLPEVPDEVDFAGVSIHLNPQSRLQIQQEISYLYANPKAIQREINTFRQLTPLLKPLLNKANLPDDFRFVALPFAHLDTLGFWALSIRQAQLLQLRVDTSVDERYHPILSTEAVLSNQSNWQKGSRNHAITLLRYLEWCANRRVPEPIDSTYVQPGQQSPPLLWTILARKLVVEHELPVYRSPVDYIVYTYQSRKGQTLQAIAQRLRLAADRVQPFNQWLKTPVIPSDKVYSVLVQVTPDEFSSVAALGEPDLTNSDLHQLSIGFPVLVKTQTPPDKLRASAIYYEINQRRGIQAQNCDNFITIAFYGHISTKAFLKFNELTVDPMGIRPGQIYYLQSKTRRAKIPFHITRRNQTLHDISNIYGVRLASLLKFNRISADQRLQAGRLVWLQTKRPADQPVEIIQLPAEEPQQTLPVISPIALSQDSAQTTPPEKMTSVITPPTADSSAILSMDSLPPNLTLLDEATVEEETARAEIANKADTNTFSPDRTSSYNWHVVRAGQTYYSIARLYGVAVNQLYTWNSLSERITLRTGQKLRIPNSPKPPVATRRPGPNSKLRRNLFRQAFAHKRPPQRKVLFYTVHAGQTLYRIALQQRVQVKEIMGWNDLKDNSIEVGQILLIWK